MNPNARCSAPARPCSAGRPDAGPYRAARRGVWRRAFTLIELLVAIAVVTVLAGLVLAVVARALQSGRQSQCVSQLSRVGKAVHLYLDDYDDRRPLRLDSLYPAYVSDRRLFICPSDAWVAQGGWAWGAWGKQITPPEHWPFPMSYGYFFFSALSDDGDWEKVRAQPGRPGYAVCVLHGESLGGGLEPGDPPWFKGLTFRLYFDGSVVRWVLDRRWITIWTLMTDQDREPPD